MSSLPNYETLDTNSKKFKIAYVDGDIFRYEIGSLTDAHPFDPNGVRIPVSPEFIYDRLDERLERIKEITGCEKLVVFLTGDSNFRFDIATIQPYKGNRTGLEKPFHYNTVGKYLLERYGAIVVNGREADDALALALRAGGEEVILCSRDKDLWTVSGWHYRWACGDYQPEVMPHYVDEYHGDLKFFTQMLIGDSTDNILGCAVRRDVYRGGFKFKSRYVPIPYAKRKKLLYGKLCPKLWKDYRVGVGESEAEKALAVCATKQDMFEVVKALYQQHRPDDWEAAMLENARLLFMGQDAKNLFSWEWIL